MLQTIAILALLTLIPALELRFSIPAGILFPGSLRLEPLGWPVVFAVCAAANVALGVVVFEVMAPVFSFVRRWGWFDRRIWPILEKTRHRLHPYVEKYGELGVAVFIGIPLPGSGVYTGAFGAYLLGLNRRKFLLANLIGVLIAGTAVTLLCLGIDKGFVGAESIWARLFLKAHGG